MPAPPAPVDAALSSADAGVALRIKVVPNASRSRIAGMLGDRLKVQLAAPAEAGKANKALCELIARRLDIKRGEVTVTLGHTQPHKTLTLAGLTAEEVARRLRPRP